MESLLHSEIISTTCRIGYLIILTLGGITILQKENNRRVTDKQRNVPYKQYSTRIFTASDNTLVNKRPLKRDENAPIVGRNDDKLSFTAIDSGRKNNHGKQHHRQCTGIFVSRASPKTMPKDIEKQVALITGHHLKCVKLNTKYETYSSFYIPCSSSVRQDLLNENVWPKGIFVKRFYN